MTVRRRGVFAASTHQHHFLKRLKEFHNWYRMNIWMTMLMLRGLVYSYATKDEAARPSEANLVGAQ